MDPGQDHGEATPLVVRLDEEEDQSPPYGMEAILRGVARGYSSRNYTLN